MILYWLIALIFVVYGLKNYTSAFILWASFSIFTHLGICLKVSQPALTLTFFLNAYFALLFFFNTSRSNQLYNSFPLKYEFSFILLSYIVSTFLAETQAKNTILNSLQEIVNNYVIIVLLWHVILTKKDVHKMISYLSFFVILSIIYGLFAYATNYNPIINFEKNLLPLDTETLALANETARGLKAQSLFFSPTNYGAYCSLFWALIMILKIKFGEKYIRFSNVSIAFLTILVICAVFTAKARSSLVAFLVLIIPFIFSKKSMRSSYFYLLLLTVLCTFPFWESFLPLFTSVFDVNSRQVEGSSVNMRINQMNIVLNSFVQHPIIGSGLKSMSMLRDSHWDLFGAESIWFWLLVERGMLGILSFVFLFVGVMRKMSYSKSRKYILFICLYWIVLQTMTTTIGIGLYWFLLIVLILYKVDSLQYEN